MYLEHFQLSAEPFSLTPDPAFLFKSEVHSEALAALKLGLIERRGLIAMIGEVGTGKTTLLYSLLSSLGPRIRTAYVSNSKLSFDGLLRSALKDFGCPADGATRLDLLDSLNGFLLDCDRLGHTAALVVDEAQNLSDEAFEEIRLLSNYETYKRKLLQIVLVGQPELDTKLRQPNLRQVTERVAVRAHVNPLSRAESLEYIRHRLAAVGGDSDIFTAGALKLIAKRSQGIPRRINVLCHNAMLFAYGRNTQQIDKAMVVSAMREREGRGLVVLGRPAGGKHRPGALARSLDSIGTAGLAWGLAGFVIGIFGAFVSMSAMKDMNAPRLPTPRTVAKAADPARDVLAAARPNSGIPIRTAAEAVKPAAKVAHIESAHAETSPPGLGHAAPVQSEPGHDAVVAQKEPVQSDADDRIAGIVRPAPRPETAAREQAKPAASTSPKEVPVAARAKIASSRGTGHVRAQEQRLASLTPAVARRPEPKAHEAARTGADTVARTQSRTPAPTSVGKVKGRVLTVAKGATLTEMVLSVYGDYSTALIDRVRRANPQIDDPDFILAGDHFRFPSTSKTVPSTGGTSRE